MASYLLIEPLPPKQRVRARLYLAEVMAEGRRDPVLVAEFNVPTPLLGVFASEKDGPDIQSGPP
ncbi:MAG: hypothetical protein QXM16_01985 [Nitrososphaerota archaeon]